MLCLGRMENKNPPSVCSQGARAGQVIKQCTQRYPLWGGIQPEGKNAGQVPKARGSCRHGPHCAVTILADATRRLGVTATASR